MLESTKDRNIWLTSDFHLLHKNIIKHCNRPFNDEYDMSEIIIRKHNLVVKDNDLVFHIGDLSFGVKGREAQLKYYLKKLKGTKVLIRGNHDEYDDDFYIKLGFTAVWDYIEIGDYFINHYPLEFTKIRPEWIQDKEYELDVIFKKSKCTKIIHGHNHTKQFHDTVRYNVGVDLHNFYPKKIEEIDEYFKSS